MKNCRVTISVFFAVLIACILMLDSSGYALLALICAAIHESGHFTALFYFRMPVREVNFKVFGIGIRLENRTHLSYGQELAVALSGCAANFIFGAVSLALSEAGIFHAQLGAFGAMNLILCTFNVLPIGPLDGGRALEALLCRRISCGKAAIIVNAVSFFFLIPVVILGFFLILKTKFNYSLILAAAYLAVSLFLKDQLIEISK